MTRDELQPSKRSGRGALLRAQVATPLGTVSKLHHGGALSVARAHEALETIGGGVLMCDRTHTCRLGGDSDHQQRWRSRQKVSALTPGWGKARWGALGGPTGVGMGREGATPWARRSADRYNVKRI